jgi:Flp pilus assembly protein CpaB
MRNKRLIIALLAAITFGLIAAVSVKQYLLSAQTFNRTNERRCRKVEIPLGSRIIPEQLAVAQFPADVTPVGAIGKIDENLIRSGGGHRHLAQRSDYRIQAGSGWLTRRFVVSHP